MSNVLIGIIGVILFIGLALAGALFLGPRFQESANNSKAAATAQAVKQISDAAAMRRTDTGAVLPSRTAALDASDALVTEGFLKAIPQLPITGASGPYIINEATGDWNGLPANMVVYHVPDAQADTCKAMARQSGQPAGDATAYTGRITFPPQPTGCFWAAIAINSHAQFNTYIAYSRF